MKDNRGARNRSKGAWIQRHVNDPYVQAANREGYRSRAAYKLIEIDDRDRLVRPGAIIVELGAAPGSWSQVLLQRLAGRSGLMRGRLLALDLLPIEPLPGLEYIAGDFHDEAVEQALAQALQGCRADLVVSDMSPNLSGIGSADAARSIDLCELALQFAVSHLKPGGAFLVKAFHGSGYSQFVEQLKHRFRMVAVRKPAASRAESTEVYLLAKGLKQAKGAVAAQEAEGPEASLGGAPGSGGCPSGRTGRLVR